MAVCGCLCTTRPLLDHQKHLSLQQSAAVYDIRGAACISDDVQWQWQKDTKSKNKRKDKDQNKDLMLSCKGSFGHLQCFLLSYFKSRMLSQTFWASILFKMRVYSARKEGKWMLQVGYKEGKRRRLVDEKAFTRASYERLLLVLFRNFSLSSRFDFFASGQPLG